MGSDKKKLFLIDGNSFCYRAFYAIRSLATSKGRPTNAVYGVITMINKIIKTEQPDMLAVAFDLKGPTFRHDKFEDYKAHRKPMPDDLVSQMPVIKEVIKAYRIPIFELQGFEADDVLATLARRAEKKSFTTFIVTGDKDAMQLVGDNIFVYNPHGDGVVFDSNMVSAKFGIKPSQVTDLLAIMGDSSDNIPGIKGIGEKGARELIEQFGSLENLLANVDKVKSNSKRELINTGKDQAVLSKELAVLDENVPIDIDFNELMLKEPDSARLVELFKDLEFRSLLKEFASGDALKFEYTIIDTVKKLDTLTKDLAKQEIIALDTETTGTDTLTAKLVGISFSWQKGEAYYVPFNIGGELTEKVILKTLEKVLCDGKIKKVGQNVKYDHNVLLSAGTELKGISFDTMVASYLLNPSKSNHNLGDISLEYLSHKMTDIEELIGKGKNAVTMDKVDIEKVKNYCCQDSDVTYRLYEILDKELKNKGLGELFGEIEMPLVRVLAHMERAGISIDTEYLKILSEEMDKHLEKHRKAIYDSAGEEFNINSPKQLQVILFEKLKYPVIKRTKTGPSTDEEVLSTLADKYPLAKELLRYREFSKLKSTYVDALPELLSSQTGKVHTSFNQTVTATGRLSSSQPNLQNIPIRTDEGRKIRKAFIASGKDQILLSADYSQIELRVLAHLSGDENLIKAFKQDKDIHRFTASLLYGVDEKDVTDKMRSGAKTVNFGIVYGMGAFRLSKDLNISIDEAKLFIDNYFARYPGIKKYLDGIIEGARKDKFVKTIMNRVRYIPEITSADVRMKNFAERTAINAPIQGSAADIIKIAMIRIFNEIRDMKSAMVLQVHDELVFNVYKDELQKVADIVRDGMENVMELNVPLKVNMEIGPNWLEMEEYNK